VIEVSGRTYPVEVRYRPRGARAGRGGPAAADCAPAPAPPRPPPTTAPAYPEEGALRAGHIPTAASVPWARAAAGDGTFKSRAELDAIYRDEVGLADGDDIVAYCRIGERSSHTWFVLQHLLGFENVRNYDGSWTEWGSAVRVPIVTGAERGEVPGR
ncbi:rhodanese-like domain-containing protein, partial [Agromyces sp. NPDC055658]